MTKANDNTLELVRRFHSRHGEAWGLIEQSGRDDEHHIGSVLPSYASAIADRRRRYEADEIEDLAVSVARWEPDGEFWSYDF